MKLHIGRVVAAAALVPALAWAHGAAHEDGKARPLSREEHPWGRQGDPAAAARTVAVDMSDDMRFRPSTIRVKRGETIRFRVHNGGAALHEMVIGTEEVLREHAALMRRFPGMEHDEPYMAHVAPGGTGEIVWTFDHPGRFRYGCLVPGHWEAGMSGTLIVEPR